MKLSVSQTSQKFFVGMVAGLAVLTLGLSAWAQDPTVFRTKTGPIPVNGETLYWTNAASWTVLSGTDGDGIPDADDTVTLYPIAWSGGYNITINQPWACSNLYVRSNDGNLHQFTIAAPGSVNMCVWSNSMANRDFRLDYTHATIPLVITEWHDIGTLRAQVFIGSWTTGWSWEKDVKITYHTTADNSFSIYNTFTNATSVYLEASKRNSVTNLEQISNVGGGQCSGPTLTLGRGDNGEQNWTVGAGSRPLLLTRQSGHGRGIRKAGLGDVNMADIDLVYDLTSGAASWGSTAIGSISADASGNNPGANTSPYGGTLRVNSYKIIATQPTTGPKHCFIAGAFVIDGQAGLSGGGAGNGRAFEVMAGTTTYVRVCTPSTTAAISGSNRPRNGRLEITPTGGSIYLAKTNGWGEIQLNVNSYETEKTNAVIIANSIWLASTNVTISDVNLERPSYTNGGATIEMRGDLVNQSIMSTNFHMESTVLRYIGGLTNDYATLEAAGKDFVLDGVGFTNNFAIGTLVLGKNSTGTVNLARVMLTDTYVNYVGATPPEAVYVNNLEMYGSSRLILNGINLYYRNGGSWTKAQTGPFANGDGSGRILTSWPVLTSGTILIVR